MTFTLAIQSFEPPSTRIVSPVIQRASSEAIEAVTDETAYLLRERMRSSRSGEIDQNGVSATTSVANFCDDRPAFCAAVGNHDLRSGFRKGKSACAFNAARGTRDKGRLSRKISHDLVSISAARSVRLLVLGPASIRPSSGGCLLYKSPFTAARFGQRYGVTSAVSIGPGRGGGIYW
jgi:hypothetical protein